MSASTEPLYIVVPRWNEFQHYSNRDPKWIKNYTRLLANQRYLGLTGKQRGLLHGIWLLYAASGRDLGANPAQLGRMLGLTTDREGSGGGSGAVRMRDLVSLSDAGFIVLSAISGAQVDASLEVEESREEKKTLAADAASNGALSEEETTKDPRPTGASSSPSAPSEAAATSSGRAAQGTGGSAGPSPGGALAKPRKRDPLWDVLVEVFGAEAVGVERGRWNAACKSLRAAEATPGQLRTAVAKYQKEWPGVAMTPLAIAANWTILTGTPKTAEQIRNEQLRERMLAHDAQNGGTA